MAEPTTYESIFIARQPLFDAKRNVWGYELLYRHAGTADAAVFTEENEATFKVMTSLSLCADQNNDCSRIMVTFPEESIMIHAPYALPPGSTIIKMRETTLAEGYFLEALRELQHNGYRVAISGYQARPEKRALCQLADILAVDMNVGDTDVLKKLTASAMEFNAMPMAAKIEDHAAFDLAKKLGFTLFQGYFFKRPETLEGRKISSTDEARLKLFRIIEELEPDFERVATAIESDVSISYRLLTLLNSPAFGFSRKIQSIKQAVVLLGWKHLRNWIRLIILTDLPSPNKTRELAFLCAQRAKFLEALALATGREHEADTLFLLGLFSLLEAMLDMPMAEIVNHLPIADPLRDALCGEENSYTQWLLLTDSVEELNWEHMERAMTALNLEQQDVERSYQEAIAWANAFFSTS